MDIREKDIQMINALAACVRTGTHNDMSKWRAEIELVCKVALTALKPRKSPGDPRPGVPYDQVAQIFTEIRDSHSGAKHRPFTSSNDMRKGVNRWWGKGDPPVGLAEIRKVVAFKYDQWYVGPESRNWLGPATLLGEKFETYLMAAEAAETETRHKREIPPL